MTIVFKRDKQKKDTKSRKPCEDGGRCPRAMQPQSKEYLEPAKAGGSREGILEPQSQYNPADN